MELGEAIRTAVTTRRFKPDPVPDELLARVLDAGRFAPQGGNRQPVRFVVVRDPEHRRQLQEWYLVPWKAYLAAAREGEVGVGARNADRALRVADRFAEHLAEAPVIVVVCAELAGVHPTDTELGRLSIVGGGSVYPAVQNVLLACRDAGLGAALTTLLCMYEPQVKELLKIPDGIATAAHLVIGYREREFPEALDRRPLSEIAFDGTWGRPLVS
jgi:nitroreductase